MSYINILIQALIQGFTEFLPVSSSGHLSVAQHFMNIEEAGLTLSVFLHLGTLLSIVIAFRAEVWGMVREFFLTFGDVFTGRFSWRGMNDDRRMLFVVIIGTMMLIPATLLRGFFSAPMGDGSIVFEGVAFLFTGVLLFMADSCVKGIKTADRISLKDALTVGFFQIIALFPGVSRSGSTISAGLFCGLSRKTAVTFSFMLGVPAIVGASLFELLELLSLRDGGATVAAMRENWFALTLGFVTAMVAGLFAIRLVKLLVKNEKFKIFAIYVTVLGVMCVVWGVFEKITGITFTI